MPPVPSLFNDIKSPNPIPPISDSVLSALDDFLIFGSETDFVLWADTIIIYLQNNLSSIFRLEGHLSEQQIGHKRDLLSLIRHIPHHLMTDSQKKTIYESSRLFMNDIDAKTSSLSFVFLVDVANSPHYPQGDDLKAELLNMSLRIIQMVPTLENEDLIFTVLSNFHLIFVTSPNISVYTMMLGNLELANRATSTNPQIHSVYRASLRLVQSLMKGRSAYLPPTCLPVLSELWSRIPFDDPIKPTLSHIVTFLSPDVASQKIQKEAEFYLLSKMSEGNFMFFPANFSPGSSPEKLKYLLPLFTLNQVSPQTIIKSASILVEMKNMVMQNPEVMESLFISLDYLRTPNGNPRVWGIANREVYKCIINLTNGRLSFETMMRLTKHTASLIETLNRDFPSQNPIAIEIASIFQSTSDVFVKSELKDSIVQFLEPFLPLTKNIDLTERFYSTVYSSIPSVFLSGYFKMINGKFSELFPDRPGMPELTHLILRKVANDKIDEVLGSELYNYTIRVLSSRNPVLIESLVEFMSSPNFDVRMPDNVRSYIKLFDTSFLSVLQRLKEDPTVSPLIGRIAILLYSFNRPAESDPHNLETWYTLMLPALSHKSQGPKAVLQLFQKTSDQLSRDFSFLSEKVQMKIFTSLLTMVRNSSYRSDIARYFLSIIPDKAIQLSLKGGGKVDKIYVNGVYLDAVFESARKLKELTAESKHFLIDTFFKASRVLGFYQTSTNPQMIRAATLLYNTNGLEFRETLIREQKSSSLYLLFKYYNECEGFEVTKDMLYEMYPGISIRESCTPTLKSIDHILTTLEITLTSQIMFAIINSAVYDYPLAKAIILKHMPTEEGTIRYFYRMITFGSRLEKRLVTVCIRKLQTVSNTSFIPAEKIIQSLEGYLSRCLMLTEKFDQKNLGHIQRYYSLISLSFANFPENPNLIKRTIDTLSKLTSFINGGFGRGQNSSTGETSRFLVDQLKNDLPSYDQRVSLAFAETRLIKMLAKLLVRQTPSPTAQSFWVYAISTVKGGRLEQFVRQIDKAIEKWKEGLLVSLPSDIDQLLRIENPREVNALASLFLKAGMNISSWVSLKLAQLRQVNNDSEMAEVIVNLSAKSSGGRDASYIIEVCAAHKINGLLYAETYPRQLIDGLKSLFINRSPHIALIAGLGFAKSPKFLNEAVNEIKGNFPLVDFFPPEVKYVYIGQCLQSLKEGFHLLPEGTQIFAKGIATKYINTHNICVSLPSKAILGNPVKPQENTEGKGKENQISFSDKRNLKAIVKPEKFDIKYAFAVLQYRSSQNNILPLMEPLPSFIQYAIDTTDNLDMVLDVTLSIISRGLKFVKTQPPNQQVESGDIQKILTALHQISIKFESLISKTGLSSISINHITKIRESLILEMPAGPVDIFEGFFLVSISLITSLSPVLFSDPSFFPTAFIAYRIFEKVTPNSDIPSSYLKALNSAISVAGIRVSRVLVSAYAKYVNYPNPLPKTPFASLCQMMKPGKMSIVMSLLCQATLPKTEEQMLIEINSMREPLHPSVYDILMKTIPSGFPLTYSARNSFPVTRALFHPMASNSQTLFSFNWSSYPIETHLTLFARLTLPEGTSQIINMMNPSDLRDICTTIGSSPSLSSFVRFYCAMYKSPLSEIFDLTSPDPQNVSGLECRNMIDDSLGSIAARYPFLKNAVMYMQQGYFEAARFFALSSHHPALFGVLRDASLNLSFVPTISELNQQLVGSEVFQQNWPLFNRIPIMPIQSLLPSFPSQTCVTWLLTSALKNAIVTGEKNRGDFRKDDVSLGYFWVSTLDRQNAAVSLARWRIQFARVLSQNPVPGVGDRVREIISNTYSNIAKLHSRSGSLRRALKYVYSSGKKTSLRFGKESLPRVLTFTRSIPHNMSPDVIQSLEEKALRLARGGLNDPKGNMIKYFRILYLYFPNMIDSSLFSYGFRYGKNILAKMMPIMIASAKLNPSLADSFFENVPKTFERQHDVGLELIAWLPLLVANFETKTTDMIAKLLPVYQIRVFMSIYHANYMAPGSKVKEIISSISKIPEWENSKDIEHVFKHINSMKADLESFELTGKAYFLLERYHNEGVIPNIPEVYAKIIGSTYEEIHKYCLENEPVFKLTKKENAGIVFISRFPLIGSQINGAFIEADGTKEGCIRYITPTGETKTVSLVSPYVYKMRDSEYLISRTINRMMSKFAPYRSPPLYYPEFCHINSSVILINCSPASLPPRKKFPFLEFSPNKSPQDVRKLKKIESAHNLPDAQNSESTDHNIENTNVDYLKNWLIEGSGGIASDFLTLRQSFASQLASFSLLRSVFRTPFPEVPGILMPDDRLNISIPGFSRTNSAIVYLPFTPNIVNCLPKWVMRGSFTSSWLNLAECLASKKDQIRILLESTISDPKVLSKDVSSRLDMHSTQTSEDTDKTDNPFSMALIDHLISVSSNMLTIQDCMHCWS